MAIKTLYVGNLPYSATESDLLDHFGAYNASKVRIVEGRGFGFVDIDEDMVETAISEKHDSEMGGRKLTVNEARPRTPGGGGGGYGGGHGGGRDRDFGGGGGGYGGGRGDRGDRGRGGRGGGGRY
jgi:RNA recognition motif-containing protein